MLRVVIDSAGDLPPGWADEYDIQVIPINIHFGERTFLQGVDLSNADFYRIADESGVIPTTSQPTPRQFVDFYRRIADPGDDIISIHVTRKLSGTLASAQMASQQVREEFRVHTIDSESGSAAMAYLAREARLMDRLGGSVESIVDWIKMVTPSITIILTLDTLEYARRSGRVRALQAALASILKVKPIVILREGILELGDRVRTRRRSLTYVIDKIVEHVGNKLVNTAVVHSEDPIAAQTLVELARTRLNLKELIVTELSIGVAANLGPGTVGVIAYPVEIGG